VPFSIIRQGQALFFSRAALFFCQLSGWKIGEAHCNAVYFLPKGWIGNGGGTLQCSLFFAQGLDRKWRRRIAMQFIFCPRVGSEMVEAHCNAVYFLPKGWIGNGGGALQCAFTVYF